MEFNMPPTWQNVVTWMARPNQNNLTLCQKHEEQERDSLMQVQHGLHRGECNLCKEEWLQRTDRSEKVVQNHNP